MKMLLKKIKNYPRIYFLLYRLYLPIKRLKNRKHYQRQYDISFRRLQSVSNRKKIFYIGIPIHCNLGDLAQYYCIRKWFDRYYPEYQVVEFSDNILCHNYKNIIQKMKPFVGVDDFFVFQSGYRTTDVANFEGEYAHQRILKNFQNRVLVFPQTVHFKSDKEAFKSSCAYQMNQRYLFLARDEISYASAKKLYDENRVLLYPDIVTSLIGNCDFPLLEENRDGILLCFRNDEEKLYSDSCYQQLMDKLKGITDKIDWTDTNSSCDFEFDRSLVERELCLKLQQFSRYKLIITDRYHGTIFSLISNTFVIVLNSTDHKLSSGVKWFQGIYDDFVFYCKDLESVFERAKEVYSTTKKRSLPSYFQKRYYDCLKDKFDEMVK